jgi:hypothetical protein
MASTQTDSLQLGLFDMLASGHVMVNNQFRGKRSLLNTGRVIVRETLEDGVDRK